MGVLVTRRIFSAEKKLAGHFEMENEGQVAAQIEEDHFAAAAQADDLLPLQLTKHGSVSIPKKFRTP